MATTTYGSPYVQSTDLVSNWPAASLTVANSIDAAGYYIGRGINAQVISYTAVLTDAGKTITQTNVAATTITIPANASVAFVVGTRINILNLGAGACTPTAGAGVTINGTITALATNESAALIKTATNTWSYLVAATPVAPGLALVTPTSVAGTGVTLSGAVVSFTTATAVSVNGCFTSTYENYVVVGTITAASGVLGVRGRMRAAGTDNSSANYDGSTDLMAASTGTITQSDGGVGATYYTGPGLASGSEGAGFKIEFFAPALTQRTGVIIHAMRSAGMYFGSNYLTVTTAYDGFTWYASSNNMSGSLRVYGLRNS